MKTRNKALLIGLGLIALLLVVVVGPQLSPLGSGSGWEFDYAIVSATVNGEGMTIDEYEDTTNTPTVDATSGGGGSVLYWLAILSQDAYHLTLDPDGSPYSNFYSGQHGGLVPNVYFQMNQVSRMNAEREVIASSAPCDNEVEVGGETWYYYYYAFDVYIETQSRQFTALNSFGSPYLTAEAGTVVAELVINVRLQETLFGEVDGEFMDATVIDTRTNLDELMASPVVYAIYPDVSGSPINSAIEIQDRTETEHSYTCTMHIPATLQCGLTRIDLGQNYVQADVWIAYTILTTLLLKEPLVIGTQGGNLNGGLPPEYSPPFDLRLVALLIGVAIFIIIIFFVWVRFRRK